MSKTDTGILYNALRTPDGTVIRSRTRHAYVSHDDANGKTYFVDGGLEYVRASCNGDEEYLTVWSDDPHEKIREFMDWGSYGVKGDQPMTYIKLKDMEDAHIMNVLYECQMSPHYADAMRKEQEFRLKKIFKGFGDK